MVTQLLGVARGRFCWNWRAKKAGILGFKKIIHCFVRPAWPKWIISP